MPADADGCGRGRRPAAVEAVIEETRELLAPGAVVVNKSTVPVGTAARTAELLDREDVAVVSQPGVPARGLGGARLPEPGPDRRRVRRRPEAAERVAALYARLGAPTVLTDAASARADEVRGELLPGDEAVLRQRDGRAVRAGRTPTSLTSPRAWATTGGSGRRSCRPGPGWGGSCLPKDTHALLQVADSVDFEFRLLRATIDTNTRQRQRIVDKVRTAVTGARQGSLAKRRLALLGLTFKAGTDDLRDSPALAVAALLRQAGAELVGYDPALPAAGLGPDAAGDLGGGRPVRRGEGRRRHRDPHRVAGVPHARLAAAGRGDGHAALVDTRNLVDPDVAVRAGFSWIGLGRRVRSARSAG